jgi:hypothetical protein
MGKDMAFLELKTRSGNRFMIDFATGWEVLDRNKDAAMWVNHQQARNLDCGETYEALRSKLLPAPPNAPQTEPPPLGRVLPGTAG